MFEIEDKPEVTEEAVKRLLAYLDTEISKWLQPYKYEVTMITTPEQFIKTYGNISPSFSFENVITESSWCIRDSKDVSD